MRRLAPACAVLVGVAGFALLAAAGHARAAPLSVADAFKSSPILSMRLSGDGKRLAAFVTNGTSAGILIIDVATMKPRVLQNSGFGYPFVVRWLGKDMLLVGATQQTHLYDGDGKLIRLVEGRYVGSLPPEPQATSASSCATGAPSISSGSTCAPAGRPRFRSSGPTGPAIAG